MFLFQHREIMPYICIATVESNSLVAQLNAIIVCFFIVAKSSAQIDIYSCQPIWKPSPGSRSSSQHVDLLLKSTRKYTPERRNYSIGKTGTSLVYMAYLACCSCCAITVGCLVSTAWNDPRMPSISIVASRCVALRRVASGEVKRSQCSPITIYDRQRVLLH